MGIALAPTDDATGTMGMAPRDGKSGDMHVGLDQCKGLLQGPLPLPFVTPNVCSRPGIYCISSSVNPQRANDSGVYPKPACIQGNTVHKISY